MIKNFKHKGLGLFFTKNVKKGLDAKDLGLSLMNSLRSKQRKPTHPGAILREDVLPSLGINQTELAERLGVSRRTVSQILHEHRPLTVDMAIRIGCFLGTTPESWLNMQQAFDVWVLMHKNARIYEQIKKVA